MIIRSALVYHYCTHGVMQISWNTHRHITNLIVRKIVSQSIKPFFHDYHEHKGYFHREFTIMNIQKLCLHIITYIPPALYEN